MDIAEAHVLALDALASRGTSFVLNLGSARGYTVREMVAAFRGVGRAAHRHRGGAAPPRRSARALGQRRARQALLGWRPRRSIVQACKRHASLASPPGRVAAARWPSALSPDALSRCRKILTLRRSVFANDEPSARPECGVPIGHYRNVHAPCPHRGRRRDVGHAAEPPAREPRLHDAVGGLDRRSAREPRPLPRLLPRRSQASRRRRRGAARRRPRIADGLHRHHRPRVRSSRASTRCAGARAIT
jgi:hypothetical protein